MKKLIEIVRNLRNIINDQADDRRISDRQLSFIIGYIRAELIRQDKDKNRPFPNGVIQSLGCIKIIPVDPSECGCTGKYIYRTKCEIPSLLSISRGSGLVYVGSIDKLHGFQINSKASSRWSAFNRYTAKGLRAFERDKYVYITGDVPCGMEEITIEGVFEDPLEVAEFRDSKDNKCFDIRTDNYPMSAHHIRTLNEMILAGELNIKLMIPDDKTNNADKDIIQTS